MITLVQVHFGEEGSFAQPVDNVVDARDWICIDASLFIEQSVVYAHAECAIFFTKE